MCHGYEWEEVRKAYMEQLARRNREISEAQKKESGKVTTPKPAAEPAPRSKDKEPVPA